jgi:hypothetical protein
MSARVIRTLPGMLFVGLVGFTVPVSAQDVTATAATTAFGDVVVGMKKSLTLTVTNSSPTTPHVINAIPSTDSHFTVTGTAPCLTFPATVPAAGSCDFNVEFHPNAMPLGSNTTSLQVDSDEGVSLPITFNGAAKILDIVILLDNSGSMSWKPNGTPASMFTESRMFTAQAAANRLLDRLGNAISSGPGGPVLVNAGVCVFNYAGLPNTGCVLPLNAFDSATLSTAISSISASGGTPMGRGLDAAIALLPATANHNRLILMLSNGAHNTGACPGGSPGFSCPDHLLDATGIKLFAIGYGTAGDVDPLKLKLIVENSGNTVANGLRHYVPVGTVCPVLPAGVDCVIGPVKGLDGFFASFLQTMGLVQAAVDPFATIRFGQTNLHDVDVTELDDLVDFSLSWEGPPRSGLRFELVTPDGQTITPSTPQKVPDIRFVAGLNHMYYVVRKGFLSSAGKIGRWRMRVTYGSPPRGIDVASAVGTPSEFTYGYAATMPSALELAVQFDRESYSTGDPMLMTASVTARGVPLRGMQIDRIEARLERPGSGIGSWYATNVATAQQLGSVPPTATADPIGAVQKKSLALRGAGVDLPFRALEPAVVFRDNGQDGDVQANDAVYTGRFTDTSRPDTHTFYIRATGRTPAGTPFTREALVQQVIPVNVVPDPATSPLTFQVVNVAGGIKQVRVQVVPKDPFANFLGPGHPDLLDFQTTAGTWLGPVEDDLLGGYSRVLVISGGQDPDVTVSVDGKSFPTTNVNGALRPRVELGLFAGRFFLDNSLPIDDGPVFGMRVGVPLSPNLTVEGEIGVTPTNDTAGNRGRVIQALGSLRWDLSGLTFGTMTPFVTGGVGVLDFTGFSTTDSGAVVQFGGGLRARVSSRTGLRLEARELFGIDTFSRNTDNFQLTFGVDIGF